MIEKGENSSSQVLEIHQGVQNITQLRIDYSVCGHYYTLFLLTPSHTNRSSCDSIKKSLSQPIVMKPVCKYVTVCWLS